MQSCACVCAESATGIREGGRTGLTALTCAFWFFIALFFTPIIASIPPFATGPALVLVRVCGGGDEGRHWNPCAWVLGGHMRVWEGGYVGDGLAVQL